MANKARQPAYDLTMNTEVDIKPSLDALACYQALKAHDARFDGRFFVGVSSTRIYCRPVCRVKLPKFENCRFFDHAALAENAGFRPCMRCRPELAVRAILGQQVSVPAGRTFTRRVVDAYGSAIETPFPELTRLLTTPEPLAAASGEALGSLGIVKHRQAAMVALMRAVATSQAWRPWRSYAVMRAWTSLSSTIHPTAINLIYYYYDSCLDNKYVGYTPINH